MWVIEKIEISGGFLPGLSVLIPKGLTCIIGARGKSTLVEAVRFAFCGISAAPKMCADLIHANLAGGALVPSRPGELHPEPLTDPDVNLSIHPARATQRRLPPSIKTRSSSGYRSLELRIPERVLHGNMPGRREDAIFRKGSDSC